MARPVQVSRSEAPPEEPGRFVLERLAETESTMKQKTVWFVIWSTIVLITSVLFFVVPVYAPRVSKEACRDVAPSRATEPAHHQGVNAAPISYLGR
jgi:hypothetical protein